MTKGHRATESRDAADILARLPERTAWMPVLLRRISRLTSFPATGKALDIGAAQGLNVVALQRPGWQAIGVEPSEQAIRASREVADATAEPVEIVPGTAESLPFPDASFELVLAQSVMEHVTDPDVVFREVARVLKPGGVFFFHTSNGLSPRQSEIAAFPLFGWYPNKLKRRIMFWARDHRPELIGGTDRPALHWFTPRRTRRDLAKAGFSKVFDHWDLKRGDTAYLGAKQRKVVELIAANRILRLLGDVGIKASAYVAVK
jgi:SAM-dependent methyltransferase